LWALIANQLDARHMSLWQAMLDGSPDPFLSGTPVDGYQGILRCPTASPGEPDLDAIGRGLKRIAPLLPDDLHGRMQFDDLLSQTRRTFPGMGEDWDYLLIEAGTRHEWPRWAAQRLRLVALAPRNGETGVPYILPWAIAEAVKHATHASNGIHYLHNLAQRVVLTGDAIRLVPPAAVFFDDSRRGVLDMADTQSEAMVSELLIPAEMNWRTKGSSGCKLAAAAKELRQDMLERSGVRFKRDASPSFA
jgi:hypothetical protein